MKNIAITAAAKLASLKQEAAEFPRWQDFSRLAPTGIIATVRFWLSVEMIFAQRWPCFYFMCFTWFSWQIGFAFSVPSVVSVAKIKTLNCCDITRGLKPCRVTLR